MKGISEQGKINCQHKLYHQNKIIWQYGQVNMTSKWRNQVINYFCICHWITRGSTNKRRERKGRVCSKPQIVLHLVEKSREEKSLEKKIVKERLKACIHGETYLQGELSFFPWCQNKRKSQVYKVREALLRKCIPSRGVTLWYQNKKETWK